MQNISQKADDDQDFLYSYGSIRSPVASDIYRKNFDRIFRQNSGQNVELVDGSSPGFSGVGENK
jgi:hypothetical protein